MKKFLMAMLIGLMTAVCSSCFAQITEADLNIGGIYIGETMETVKEKYGEPVKILSVPGTTNKREFIFSDGDNEIKLTFKDGNVSYGIITKNSKFLTSRNIGIGNNDVDVIKAYGNPDKTYVSDYPGVKSSFKEYIYYTFDLKLLNFVIDKGIVKSVIISLGSFKN